MAVFADMGMILVFVFVEINNILYISVVYLMFTKIRQVNYAMKSDNTSP